MRGAFLNPLFRQRRHISLPFPLAGRAPMIAPRTTADGSRRSPRLTLSPW